MASLELIAQALADAVSAVELPADPGLELQIATMRQLDATPPVVDIFEGDPAQDDAAFGDSRQTFWTVRARVSSADADASQAVLRSLMEPRGATSVREALIGMDTDGIADGFSVQGPTGQRIYANPEVNPTGALLGCEWRVVVFMATGATS